MIYGPHDLNEEKRFIPDLIKQRLNNFPAVPVNGVDKKNIIYVNDLCNDIISAIECQKKTDVLYLCSCWQLSMLFYIGTVEKKIL